MPHPPFRADHVGSLLRPPELLQARAEHRGRPDRGRGTARASRTTAIREAVAMQARARPQGRHRRRVPPRLLAHGFPLPDRRRHQDRADAEHRVQERGRHGRVHRRPRIGSAGKLTLDKTIFGEDFAFLKSVAPAGTAEADDPVAVDAALPRRPGGDRRRPPIPTWRRSGTTSPRSTRRRSPGSRALGCTYLQLDDTSLAYLNDPAQRAYVTSIGGDGEHAAPDQHPADQPGARRQARRHDRVHPYVPRQFPLVLGGRGRLRPCRRGAVRRARGRRLLPRIRRCALGRLRAAALRAEREQEVVLGLVTSKAARRSKARTS